MLLKMAIKMISDVCFEKNLKEPYELVKNVDELFYKDYGKDTIETAMHKF
jgi:hypothetical protein